MRDADADVASRAVIFSNHEASHTATLNKREARYFYPTNPIAVRKTLYSPILNRI